MAPRKPRNLRPDEVELWQKVADQATRLRPLKQAVSETKILTKSDPIKPKNLSIPAFRIGDRTLSNPIQNSVGQASTSMDSKAFKKMKSGKLSPEARIDLHGMTLAEAHPRLIGFIQRNAADGRRLVLVITGKGRPGVLRHQVPHWLHTLPLKPLVLQVHEASRNHGGQGAIYVYLRRQRG